MLTDDLKDLEAAGKDAAERGLANAMRRLADGPENFDAPPVVICAICSHRAHLMRKCDSCDHVDPKTTDALSGVSETHRTTEEETK